MDKASIDRFQLSTECSSYTDLSKLAADIPNNLELESKSCLALVKGADAASSRIQSLDCALEARVLCGYSLDGCTGPGSGITGTGSTTVATTQGWFTQPRG